MLNGLSLRAAASLLSLRGIVKVNRVSLVVEVTSICPSCALAISEAMCRAEAQARFVSPRRCRVVNGWNSRARRHAAQSACRNFIHRQCHGGRIHTGTHVHWLAGGAISQRIAEQVGQQLGDKYTVYFDGLRQSEADVYDALGNALCNSDIT